ncbi:hypothetical protein MIDIC_590025 [Alphaproteobacteria bacterium]
MKNAESKPEIEKKEKSKEEKGKEEKEKEKSKEEKEKEEKEKKPMLSTWEKVIFAAVAALFIISNPFGWALGVTAVVGAAAGVAAVATKKIGEKAVEKIKEKTGNVWEKVKDKAGKVWEKVKEKSPITKGDIGLFAVLGVAAIIALGPAAWIAALAIAIGGVLVKKGIEHRKGIVEKIKQWLGKKPAIEAPGKEKEKGIELQQIKEQDIPAQKEKDKGKQVGQKDGGSINKQKVKEEWLKMQKELSAAMKGDGKKPGGNKGKFTGKYAADENFRSQQNKGGGLSK